MSPTDRATTGSVVDEDRIGRQLHDIVVPQLFVLTSGLTALRRRGGGPDAAMVNDLVEVATKALGDLRRISRGEDTAHAGRLRDLAARLCRETRFVGDVAGCSISVDVDGDAEIEPALADDLIAFVWEGVANALRHGRAGHVALFLRADTLGLVLVVEDDGSWSDPDDDTGTGVRGLRGRAARWGGCVSVTPQRTGTRLTWTTPLIAPDGGTAPR